MRARAGLMVHCFVLTALLGGCTSGGSDSNSSPSSPSGAGGGHGAHDAMAHLLAPNWTVGDWWTLNSPQLGPFTHALSRESSDSWTMDTDNRDVAFHDARFDISFLGNVRKSDLAGSQGSDAIQFFQFPLTAGKTWTTPWDGLQISIHVTTVTNGRASLEANHANGTPFATYTYDSEAGYFRDYKFFAADGASIDFEATLTASGKDFAGDLVRWSLETLEENTGTGPAQGGTDPFQVADGTTDLWLAFHINCPSNGGYALAMNPVAPTAPSQAFLINDECSGKFDVEGVVVEAPTAGTWNFVREFGGGPDSPTATILLLARTLQPVTIA